MSLIATRRRRRIDNSEFKSAVVSFDEQKKLEHQNHFLNFY